MAITTEVGESQHIDKQTYTSCVIERIHIIKIQDSTGHTTEVVYSV